jgi:predicted metal-dependent hydrolase
VNDLENAAVNAANADLPIIATFLDSSLQTNVQQRLTNQYRFVTYPDVRLPDGLVAALADDQAALMLIEPVDEEWSARIAAVKTSPATRRVPIIAISDNEADCREARLSGANQCLSRGDFLASLETLVTQTARLVSTEQVEAMWTSCQEDLPPQARVAVEMFNQGQYYKQHDLFEALWMETEGPIRDLYRAILQVGIAYYQITRGNERGAMKMLLRSLQWLAMMPDKCQGVDIGQLKSDVANVRQMLEIRRDLPASPFDVKLLKPIVLTPR